MDRREREPVQTRMIVNVVVPIEETAAERLGILDTTEPCRKSRPVLQRFELGLGERIVIGHVGAAMGLGDAEVRQAYRSLRSKFGRNQPSTKTALEILLYPSALSFCSFGGKIRCANCQISCWPPVVRLAPVATDHVLTAGRDTCPDDDVPAGTSLHSTVAAPG